MKVETGACAGDSSAGSEKSFFASTCDGSLKGVEGGERSVTGVKSASEKRSDGQCADWISVLIISLFECCSSCGSASERRLTLGEAERTGGTKLGGSIGLGGSSMDCILSFLP